MTSPYWLETDRCRLRRFTPEDRDWLRELYSDPDVARYLGGPLTAEQADALLQERILGYYDTHPGLGMWMTEEKATGKRLGFHLLNTIRGESLIQVGFVLAKPAWGRGIATEVGRAVLRYGFTELELPRIHGMTSRGNAASLKVLAKIGLHRRGERAFSHPAYASEGPLAWFERDAADWLAENPAV